MAGRLIAFVLGVLAVACAGASLLLFFGIPMGTLAAVRLEWPPAALLVWDALLCLAFFVQHSVMVRPGFRDRTSRLIPPRYQRLVYSIASGIVLLAVVFLWQPTRPNLLTLAGPFLWGAYVLWFAGIALFIWGALVLRDLDLFGLRAVRSKPAPVFLVRGPYRWVRHPWYLAAILTFWSYPNLSADRLLFNLLWSAWVVLGASWEEVDLLRQFGPAYAEYCRKVPRFLPSFALGPRGIIDFHP